MAGGGCVARGVDIEANKRRKLGVQPLSGIARLAALAPTLASKRAVTYLLLPSRQWVNRTSSTRMPFAWTINPYRGCEFGCRYCYARYTHEFMELRRAEDFEQRIFAKHFQPSAFRQELARIPKADPIAIGTATDPYQPAERRFLLTRRMLEVLAQEHGRMISLTTKSDLIVRDCDLLERVARRNALEIHVTITTMDAELARLLEPKAPRPELRLRAVAALLARGIAAGVSASPVMPAINDSLESLSGVAEAAARVGARSFAAGVLFLKPCSRGVFLQFLRERFPHLEARYSALYSDSAFVGASYRALIEKRVEAVRRRYKLEGRLPRLMPGPSEDGQLPLFTL